MNPMTRPVLVGLALGSVLVTTACGQPTPSGSATAAGGGAATAAALARQTAGHGVRLEATMAVGSPRRLGANGIRRMPGLVVDYTLTNAGSTPLVAYDVVPASLGSAALPTDIDRDHAWVYVDSGVLRLSKQGFAPAQGVRFIAAPTTGARALDAGAGLTGRAYAATPPSLDVPGPEFDAPRAAVGADVREWQFCVQVGPRTTQMRRAKGGGDLVEAPVTAPSGDDLVCTEPRTIPVA
jgi:hypothetical protein